VSLGVADILSPMNLAAEKYAFQASRVNTTHFVVGTVKAT